MTMYAGMYTVESTIDSEGFKGGTRGTPIMPRDAVSRTANVERTVRHKWVKDVSGWSSLALVRANLTMVTSPPYSSPRWFPSYLLLTLLLYFIFIIYLPRCTLPNFPSVSSLASLLFLPCCHRTTTTHPYSLDLYSRRESCACLTHVPCNLNPHHAGPRTSRFVRDNSNYLYQDVRSAFSFVCVDLV